MLPVPDASVPAVEICSERSAAGITFSARDTLKQLRNILEENVIAEYWIEQKITIYTSINQHHNPITVHYILFVSSYHEKLR